MNGCMKQEGPGVFSNITWIKNTFGEAVAKQFNVFIAWVIIGINIVLILGGVWLHIAFLTSKK